MIEARGLHAPADGADRQRPDGRGQDGEIRGVGEHALLQARIVGQAFYCRVKAILFNFDLIAIFNPDSMNIDQSGDFPFKRRQHRQTECE